jgi:hypothetical protein
MLGAPNLGVNGDVCVLKDVADVLAINKLTHFFILSKNQFSFSVLFIFFESLIQDL